MAFGFAAPKTTKAPAGMDGTSKPSFWTILDGVLGGDTISEAAYNARARQASLANSAKQSALNDQIAALLAGDGIADPLAQAAAPRAQGPGLDGEPVAGPATALSTLPKRRTPADFSQLAGPLAMMALGGNERASKVADILAKNRPDIAIADDGTPYNKNDPAILNGRRFGKPTVVGKTILDLTKPENLERTVPEVGEGMELLYDGQGRPQVRPIQGYAGAAAAKEGAVTGAREIAQAPFKMVEIKMPDGSVEQMTLEDFQSRRGPSPSAGGAAGGRSQTPADAEYAKGQAKAAQERFQKVQADGAAAPTKIANLQQIGTLLDGVEGGKLSPLGLDVAQAANSLGFKIDSKLANKEAANALSQQIALSFKDQLPGPLSNADRQFLVQMAPGISQSAQGRKLMIDSAAKVYQRQADVARMARAWQQKYGRLDAVNPATGKGFDDNLQVWVERNKLFSPQAKK